MRVFCRFRDEILPRQEYWSKVADQFDPGHRPGELRFDLLLTHFLTCYAMDEIPNRENVMSGGVRGEENPEY